MLVGPACFYESAWLGVPCFSVPAASSECAIVGRPTVVASLPLMPLARCVALLEHCLQPKPAWRGTPLRTCCVPGACIHPSWLLQTTGTPLLVCCWHESAVLSDSDALLFVLLASCTACVRGRDQCQSRLVTIMDPGSAVVACSRPPEQVFVFARQPLRRLPSDARRTRMICFTSVSHAART
jgi:hypothetical protein